MVRDDNCETDVKSQREHYVEKQMINCNNKKRDKSERLLGSSLRHCSSRFHSGFCIASVSHKKYSSKFHVTLLGNSYETQVLGHSFSCSALLAFLAHFARHFICAVQCAHSFTCSITNSVARGKIKN